MKLIIAGSRNLYPSFDFILTSISMLEIQDITEIVSGGANGVDSEGEHFASLMELPVTIFPADWSTYGKSAGPRRNKEMAEYADCLLLIWTGDSPGSRNMKDNMVNLGKPVYEVILKGANNG